MLEVLPTTKVGQFVLAVPADLVATGAMYAGAGLGLGHENAAAQWRGQYVPATIFTSERDAVAARDYLNSKGITA